LISGFVIISVGSYLFIKSKEKCKKVASEEVLGPADCNKDGKTNEKIPLKTTGEPHAIQCASSSVTTPQAVSKSEDTERKR
jgi:hypothetical protein